MIKLSWNFKLVVYFILVGTINCGSAPSFRVVAPQLICPSTSSTVSSQPQSVTVSFYPKNGERLKYKFQIFFKNIGSFRSQRRTLEMWKSVRSLEQRVNVEEQTHITDTNLLIINKSEVTPGASYIFHVTGETENGLISRNQNFSIKYLLGKNNDNISSTVNILLLGPESLPAGVPFMLIAKLIFCQAQLDYFFRWNIPTLDNKFKRYTHTTSSVLRIPPGVLKPGKDYVIGVSVLQSNNSERIGQNKMSLNVLKRAFEVSIIPTSVTVGLNQKVLLEVIVTDFNSDNEPFEVSWASLALSGRQQICENCKSMLNTKYEISFNNLGRYTVTAKVSKGLVSQMVTSTVNVEADVFVHYEFDETPNLFLNKGQQFSFSLFIKNLIPNCQGEWITALEKGFEFISITEFDLGKFKITDLERNYLTELVDFNNTAVEEESTLYISEPAGNFKSLKGDSKYKFRMIVRCPNPYFRQISRAPQWTESFFDFVVITNSPPQGAILEITPKEGHALRTIFQFSTARAKDMEIDEPFSYEFLYRVNNLTVSVGTFYDYRIAETVFPFSNSPIETMYTVCDIRAACSTIIGPKVKVSLTNITRNEAIQKQSEIITSFKRTDFYNGQRLMLMCALTFKELNDKQIFTDFQDFSLNLLTNEVDKQYERPDEPIYSAHEDLFKFIRLTKQNLDVLEVMKTDILRKLLDLLESATEDPILAENIDFRKKRQTENVRSLDTETSVDRDFVELSLDLMETLLESVENEKKDDEMKQILEKINQLIVKICKSNKISKLDIRKKLIILNLWKLQGKQIFGKRFKVDNFILKPVYFVLTFSELKNSNKFCLAFIQLPEDFLTGKTNSEIYSLQLYNNISLISSEQLPLLKDNKNGVEILLPISQKNVKCLAWTAKDSKWSQNNCRSALLTDYVSCKCNEFSYLRLTHKSGDTESNGKPQNLIPLGTTSGHSLPSPTFATQGHTKKNIVNANDPVDDPDPTQTDIKVNEAITPPPNTVLAGTVINYLLPVICIISILLIVGGVVLYHRKRRKGKDFQNEIHNIEHRQFVPGIKYGKFHDEHLLGGNM